MLQVASDPAPDHRQRACLECGEPFLAHKTQARHAEFCGDTCRRSHKNRRAMRGAALYDLFMTLRYQRGVAQKLHVWRQLCRLAADFRLEDHQQRAGRQSWRAAVEVLAERPYLNAIVVADKTWRRFN